MLGWIGLEDVDLAVGETELRFVEDEIVASQWEEVDVVVVSESFFVYRLLDFEFEDSFSGDVVVGSAIAEHD